MENVTGHIPIPNRSLYDESCRRWVEHNGDKEETSVEVKLNAFKMELHALAEGITNFIKDREE